MGDIEEAGMQRSTSQAATVLSLLTSTTLLNETKPVVAVPCIIKYKVYLAKCWNFCNDFFKLAGPSAEIFFYPYHSLRFQALDTSPYHGKTQTIYLAMLK